jgi:hypothetical protein
MKIWSESTSLLKKQSLTPQAVGDWETLAVLALVNHMVVSSLEVPSLEVPSLEVPSLEVPSTPVDGAELVTFIRGAALPRPSTKKSASSSRMMVEYIPPDVVVLPISPQLMNQLLNTITTTLANMKALVGVARVTSSMGNLGRGLYLS